MAVSRRSPEMATAALDGGRDVYRRSTRCCVRPVLISPSLPWAPRRELTQVNTRSTRAIGAASFREAPHPTVRRGQHVWWSYHPLHPNIQRGQRSMAFPPQLRFIVSVCSSVV